MPYLSGCERYIAYKPTEKPTETPAEIRVCALWFFAKKNEEHRVATLLSIFPLSPMEWAISVISALRGALRVQVLG